MKKIILVTGGAGFVGSNMIENLLQKTNYNILSLDDYSSGLNKIIFLVRERLTSKEIQLT